MRFARYGNSGQRMEGISLDSMLRIQRDGWRQGIYLFANAEDSGCEGCYCEVAIWHEQGDMNGGEWKRFAFGKFFDGENPGFPDETAWETASRYARQLNDAASGGCPAIIHGMPCYDGVVPLMTNGEPAST